MAITQADIDRLASAPVAPQKLLIDGAWVEGQGGETVVSYYTFDPQSFSLIFSHQEVCQQFGQENQSCTEQTLSAQTSIALISVVEFESGRNYSNTIMGPFRYCVTSIRKRV